MLLLGVLLLCEVIMEMLEGVKVYMLEVVYCCVKYIVIENVRILVVS